MDIYHHFEARGITDSQRHFSTAWFCCAESVRADRGPSADVLITLFQTLIREGHLMLAARVGWAVVWLPAEARR